MKSPTRIPLTTRIPITTSEYLGFIDDQYGITEKASWWASLPPWELASQVKAMLYYIEKDGYPRVPEFYTLYCYIGGTSIFYGTGD